MNAGESGVPDHSAEDTLMAASARRDSLERVTAPRPGGDRENRSECGPCVHAWVLLRTRYEDSEEGGHGAECEAVGAGDRVAEGCE